jgi:peptidoglycan/LPS O-acetylase OafA/YrhL
MSSKDVVMSVFQVRTLAAASAQGQDNFLLLRLLAASLVIYGHGPAISGDVSRPDLFVWLGLGVYSGDLAVNAFFAISGFMIAGSYLRRRHLPSFLWARALRIYPAYAFCLLMSAYVLGSVFTTLPLADYLRNHEVLHYVQRNLELRQGVAYRLPGVFEAQAMPGVMNGSIWTLPAEVRMYLWVALAGVVGVLGRAYLANVLIAGLIAWGIARPDAIPLVNRPEFARLAGYFALGVFCLVNRRRIYVGWPIVAATGVLAWVAHGSVLYPFALAVALASFVFAFAYDTPWYGYNRFGDYSYGLYLWGFPMQQVTASEMPGASALTNALIAWMLALAVAVVSWHMIEKPALALRPMPSRLYARLMAARRARPAHRLDDDAGDGASNARQA